MTKCQNLLLYTWAKVLVGLARQKRHAPGRNHRHLCGDIEALLAPGKSNRTSDSLKKIHKVRNPEAVNLLIQTPRNPTKTVLDEGAIAAHQRGTSALRRPGVIPTGILPWLRKIGLTCSQYLLLIL